MLKRSIIKVCHLTSAHERDDIRIFRKECISLFNMGYRMFLIVADGLGNDLVDSIQIIDVGKPKNRLKRFTSNTWKIFNAARKINADIYHFHDPDLMFVSLLLKKGGKKVIYDAHEDFPKQLIGKPYLPKVVTYILSDFFYFIEKIIGRYYNFIIAATPSIGDKFKFINSSTEVINNYPFQNELKNEVTDWNKKERMVCFVGIGSEMRGLTYLIKSHEKVKDCKFVIAGEINPAPYKEFLSNLNNEGQIIYTGRVSRLIVKEILSKAKAGIVTYLAHPNHLNAQPNKLFEYMSAGLPVICSNFPKWKELVLENNLGLCVNPMDDNEIANAINYIISHDEEAQVMGANGRKAIMEKYNWEKEKIKLERIYDSLISNNNK
jgi:glycosyltransferase involved in cell wall biosynthesis